MEDDQTAGRDGGEGLGGDPLDGDPLDGDPASSDGADDDLVKLDIVRSGRPESAPNSIVAYDDDTRSSWIPSDESEGSWLWLDLGEERELRQIRWLTRGSGTIDLSISHDRKHWDAIDAGDRRQLWQETSLREEGRYLRLELIPGDDGKLPEIAEVEVYGTDSNPDTSLAQKAKKDRKSKKDRNRKDKGDKSNKSRPDDAKSSRDDKPDKAPKRDKSSKGDRAVESRDGVSVQAGETHCSGDRERCRARAGRVSMEDDCGDGGTCTIDIQADGGSATCDATGGNENKAGDGEGKRNGNGGRCEAVADGGAVSIGDINP